MRATLDLRRIAPILCLLVLIIAAGAGPSVAQDEFNPYPLRPPDTSSPRATLQSFRANMIDAIERWQDGDNGPGFQRAREAAARSLDLSGLPPAVRDDQAGDLLLFLMEILGRIELPPAEEIPDRAEVAATGLTSWAIPQTEITIARTEEGPDAGAFQFSAATVADLPAFYERVEHLPYRRGALVGVYEDITYSPGPWLPREWTTDLPALAYDVVLEQTVWQWVAAILTILLVTAIVTAAYVLAWHVDRSGDGIASRRHLGRITATVFAIPLIQWTYVFLDDGVNLTGTPLLMLQVAKSAALVVAVGWLVLLILKAIGEMIIRVRATGPRSVDAQLVRIIVRVLAIVALFYLAIYAAEAFGIPVAPLVASLGVGGLAIALAVRPTLENVVGGFILFADKPVRVGEFCLFGDKMGTVEEVGLRSTRIRGLDRTVITVPNAEFAQLQIVNFTRRDRMLMQSTLGLRHETTPDQLRYVLTKLRELFVAHPKVLPEPARARFSGFSNSSLNVDIFIYVESKDYNEFLGIAEDLNLRIMAIVSEAGTGFAFPSQTTYLARDGGLDAERADAVEAEVRDWRADGALPFPGLARERVAALDGSLDFPPEGSVDLRQVAPTAEEAKAGKRPRWRIGRSRRSERS